jgi:hypothetical protein
MPRAVIIIFLLIMAGLTALFYLGMENPPVSLSLQSANKIYTVQLNEKADRFLLPIHLGTRSFNSEVRFTALKGEQSLAKDEMLWSDSSDNRQDVYKYHWISDSIIKYGEIIESVPESKMDEVTVTNETNQSINYLVVEANEKFLILDIQPQSSVKFLAYPQSWLNWISGEGKFSSGKAIPFVGKNFRIGDDRESHVPKHYCVSIKDNEMLIQSEEIKGY